VNQTAELLNLSVITIYRMVSDGRIVARKLGFSVFIDPEVLGLKEIPEQLEVKVLVKVGSNRNTPAYGEVGIKVVLLDSQVVRVETTTSVSKLVSKNGKN